MVEKDTATGLPIYYDFIITDITSDYEDKVLARFATQEEAEQYIMQKQPAGCWWVWECVDRTQWFCKKRVGTFNVEEHGIDIAQYEGLDDYEEICRIADKSYKIEMQVVTTMHEDNLYIPWSMGRIALASDDGFMEAISKINKYNRNEFEETLKEFINDASDVFAKSPNIYWTDWEDCDWFNDNNNKVTL